MSTTKGRFNVSIVAPYAEVSLSEKRHECSPQSGASLDYSALLSGVLLKIEQIIFVVLC